MYNHLLSFMKNSDVETGVHNLKEKAYYFEKADVYIQLCSHTCQNSGKVDHIFSLTCTYSSRTLKIFNLYICLTLILFCELFP